ncbi:MULTISPECIES: class I SAM-dependent methyltransferase [unclassified Gemella]|uniref:class I SAM-dependent methyltransferase n=1 Tax=unclassified Gemella TaxID=2624949 RepID=UPI0010742874|nr:MULTISPECIES: class I SAM-dependent methyltransferase [unclassified Gemella]MBF0710047.1 class I SAM-dependent methyltransferase [Gemella sp. GL1.1]MBF0746126.1 class I SAM-dependent methyltransferase [Gemella sp. 19428wG2_WT2a]NYS27391.1 class I SAM-dependent methyltransferase [Gemella sp. GL1]TFU60415.1 SAM-dependent methyltransferase [Gemella sp. WT2a]
MIVTTNVNKRKANNELEEEAIKVAKYFNCQYIDRGRLTVKELIGKFGECIIIYKQKTVYINKNFEELYFHLDTAMLRIKNKCVPLLKIIEGREQSILDMTMGLARDSITLSYFGHKVEALEDNKIIHYIVSNGLKKFDSGKSDINEAMRRIKTYNINSLDFLKKQESKSIDYIYLDPMFIYKIKDSSNISIFDSLACQDSINDDLMNEMTRVAKKKIILKAHKLDPIFEKYNFNIIERVGAKFFYGYIGL